MHHSGPPSSISNGRSDGEISYSIEIDTAFGLPVQ